MLSTKLNETKNEDVKWNVMKGYINDKHYG